MNMRSVAIVEEVPFGDAACLRFSMMREQTMLCTTRSGTTKYLRPNTAYQEGGTISRRLERLGVPVTGEATRAIITVSDEADLAV